MQIKVFYFNPLRECTYLVWDKSLECTIIDPGALTSAEKKRVVAFVVKNNLKPSKIILTHGHFDHLFAADDFAKYWNIPIYMHPADDFLKERMGIYCAALGVMEYSQIGDTVNIADGDVVRTGSISFKVLSTPGHTPGSVCLLAEGESGTNQHGALFCGDTFFRGDIGNTGLEGGSAVDMAASIARLCTLPDEIEVYPGHGYTTTIASEKRHNPYFAECLTPGTKFDGN